MENEQAKTIEVLQLAVRMEVEGKEFYQKASRKSSNKLAKELFQQLASEEDVHRKKFEEIYKAFKRGLNWPEVEPPSEKGKRIKSLFADATKALGSQFEVAESEFEAIKIAMDMEVKSYDLYYSRSKESTLPVEKQFYQTLAGEERGHHLALLDAYEYLSNPAGWFTKKEHWSLDGI
ncbi:MAG TPA: ferritin family protein [Dehalococcoidia bacterium]|nr:ferritin family protein [Dehalococcoidia bacterium]